MRILIVEDNIDLAQSLSDYLSINGCVCEVAYNGKMGLELTLSNEYDIYIFDISMPLLNGLDLCSIIRKQQYDQTPILFLTSRDTLEDKLEGFNAGADDYLIKPFELKELLARIKALFNRSNKKDHLIKHEDLEVNLLTGQVFRDNTEIILTSNLFKILETLLKFKPNIISRNKLEYIVWGDDPPDSDSLRTHIYKLRQKVDKPFEKALIETIKGRGFRIK